MSFHHPVQTFFFPSKHSSFIHKAFRVRCLIKNNPLSTGVLTAVKWFSLSNQTREKKKTWAKLILHVVWVFVQLSIFSYLNVFTCDVLHYCWKKFGCILSLGNQLIERWKWRMKHHTDVFMAFMSVVILNMILIRDACLSVWRTPTILFIASSFRDSLLLSSISFRSSFLQRNMIQRYSSSLLNTQEKPFVSLTFNVPW